MNPPPAQLLLGRPEFAGDLEQAAAFARGQRVLITGAAGSVGTPLARALAAAEPEQLVLLDHHEYSLFGLERSLGPRANVAYELADVRDTPRLGRILGEHRPGVVFHLAAAKHVPYGERFPEGAVATNVLALDGLLDWLDEYQVPCFVYPSSDKSVDPPSLYGATKRLAEALVQARAHDRRWSIVRYVNIIGTRGSVVEIFTDQAQQDRPLSVTDERMTRYWISMDEALWCVLQAAQHGAPGQVLMPACTEAVPIVETAQRLAAWYQPEHVPYPIVLTGSRPGERLDEVLLSRHEALAPGPAPGVLGVQTERDPARVAEAPAIVAELRVLVANGEREELRRRAREAADWLQ